jgi:hypothetical protein
MFGAFEAAIGFIPPEDAEVKAAATATMKAAPAIAAAIHSQMADHTPEAKASAAKIAMEATTAALATTLTGGAAASFAAIAPVATGFLSMIMDAFQSAPAAPPAQ